MQKLRHSFSDSETSLPVADLAGFARSNPATSAKQGEGDCYKRASN